MRMVLMTMIPWRMMLMMMISWLPMHGATAAGPAGLMHGATAAGPAGLMHGATAAGPAGLPCHHDWQWAVHLRPTALQWLTCTAWCVPSLEISKYTCRGVCLESGLLVRLIGPVL